MDGQPFSQVFKQGLSPLQRADLGLSLVSRWAFYEPLIEASSLPDKKAGVQHTVARFWDMLDAPPPASRQ
jgi:hypothetical protein